MNTNIWLPEDFDSIENLTIFKFWWFSFYLMLNTIVLYIPTQC